jgi:hypothetical protein
VAANRLLPNYLTDPASAFSSADLDAVIARHPEVGEVSPQRRVAVLKTAAEAAAQAVTPGYLDRTALDLARHFEEARLGALVSYIESPSGRSSAAKLPLLQAQIRASATDLAPQVATLADAALCGAPPPPAPATASPSAAAQRLAALTGRYRIPPLSFYLPEDYLSGDLKLDAACAAGRAQPTFTARLTARNDAVASLAPVFTGQVAAAYDRVFTPAELTAMSDFQASPAEQAFEKTGLRPALATAMLVFELDAQFAQSACHELGCRTPPDAPRSAWAEPSHQTLALAREAVADELGDVNELPARTASIVNGFFDWMPHSSDDAAETRQAAARRSAIDDASARLRRVLPTLVDDGTRLYAEA